MRYLLCAAAIWLSCAAAWAEMGFDPKYQRDYNIFNPVNKFRPDNPLNPINSVDARNPFNPINRYDPENPANPINRYNPNNPFNPINEVHPDNPLNPINRYNPIVPFRPLGGFDVPEGRGGFCHPLHWPINPAAAAGGSRGDEMRSDGRPRVKHGW